MGGIKGLAFRGLSVQTTQNRDILDQWADVDEGTNLGSYVLVVRLGSLRNIFIFAAIISVPGSQKPGQEPGPVVQWIE